MPTITTPHRPRVPNPEAVAAARSRVRDRFGATLERKATDAFCLRLRRSLQAGVESASRRLQPRIAVLDLSGAPDSIERIAAQVVRPAPDSLADAAEGRGVDKVLRERLVAVLAQEFAEYAAGLAEEMEAQAQKAFGAAVMAAESRAGVVTSELLWIDGTVRVPFVPQALAEIVADDRIEEIDVPRVVAAEMLQTLETVGIGRFRARSPHTGRGVVIGLLDTEVDASHPALPNVSKFRNLTDERWGLAHAHATAVAGIIGARGDTYSGIAPDAEIRNYKVIPTRDADDAGDARLARGIQAALQDGVDIVNCSLGVGPATATLTREARACNRAWALGLTIVKSAGNEGPAPMSLTNPAQADGVIVVGATDAEGRSLQPYSSRGPTPSGADRPHLLAPSGSKGAPMSVCRKSGRFGRHRKALGTSFAAPHVTGVLALMLEADPSLTPDDLRERLLKSCTPLHGVAPDAQGAGLVSLDAL